MIELFTLLYPHLTISIFDDNHLKQTMSESCFTVTLKEREFSKDLQLTGVLEYRNGTFDILYGNMVEEVLRGRKYF